MHHRILIPLTLISSIYCSISKKHASLSQLESMKDVQSHVGAVEINQFTGEETGHSYRGKSLPHNSLLRQQRRARVEVEKGRRRAYSNVVDAVRADPSETRPKAVRESTHTMRNIPPADIYREQVMKTFMERAHSELVEEGKARSQVVMPDKSDDSSPELELPRNPLYNVKSPMIKPPSDLEQSQRGVIAPRPRTAEVQRPPVHEPRPVTESLYLLGRKGLPSKRESMMESLNEMETKGYTKALSHCSCVIL